MTIWKYNNFSLKNTLYQTLVYAKLLLLAFFLFILSVPFAISLSINEIMYNPSGADTDHEWIEIYNNDSISYNLTGWKLRTGNVTSGTDHTLNVPPANGGQGSMLVAPGGYLVIVQDGSTFVSDHAGYNGTVIDSSWTDLPDSSNSTIVLKNSTYVFDNITYSLVSEGKTICRINNSFVECTPTPGASNAAANQTDASPDIILSVLLNTGFVNNSYILFGINITNKTCTALDNITLSYNITPGNVSDVTAEIGCSSQLVSWIPLLPGNYTICGLASGLNESNTTNNEACKTIEVLDAPSLQCDLSLSILSGSITNASQEFDYSLFVNDTSCNQTAHNITLEYWIEDLFGNYVKDKANTTQTMTCSKSISRQWTPDDISGTEAYRIVGKLVSKNCADSNPDNDLAEKIIVVKGASPETDSVLMITGINPENEVKYGEDLDVSIYAFRNDTNKYSINVWVEGGEKISDTTTLHARSKNTQYNLTLPVRLKPNCDGNYPDGIYTVVAEGLGKNSTANVTVKGISSSFCKISASSSNSGGGGGSSAAPKNDIEIISYPESVHIGEEFEVVVKVQSAKKFSVYSYVYKGNTPVSEGFNDGEWRGSWDANKKDFTNSATVSLMNRIEKGTEPGMYSLRAKLKTDKEEYVTKDIEVLEERHQENVTVNVENKTSSGRSPILITGFATNKINKKIDMKYLLLLHLLSKIISASRL